MTASALFPVLLWKEVRGLTPAWLASVALMTAGLVLGNRMRAMGILGYLVGAIALGALSMGHEYNGRTLTLLLSQPSRRDALFIRKFGVLSAMVLTLAAIAWIALLGPDPILPEKWRQLAFGLPIVCGLFLAPWLTMVCGSALAGAVFAVAVPGAIWVASDITSTIVYGGELSTIPAAVDLAFDVFWRTILIVSMLAAVATWWMFMRLEAIESRGLAVNLPSWFSGRARSTKAPDARPHPVVLLIGKELHLQQLTFAVSGLYLLAWFGLIWFGDWLPQAMYRGLMTSAVTLLYAAAIPLIAGSIASAEERHLGTLGWQLLLPVATWKQWTAKAGVVIALTLFLSFVLPAALWALTGPLDDGTTMGEFFTPGVAAALVGIAVISLYVSSLSPNSMRALLTSLPCACAFPFLIMSLSRFGGDRRFGTNLGILNPSAFVMELLGPREHVFRAILIALIAVAAIGAPALLLRFGLLNHRSADRRPARMWRQIAIVAAALVAFLTIGGQVSSAYVDGIIKAVETRERTTGTRVEFQIGDSTAARAADIVVLVFTGGEGVYSPVRRARDGRFFFNVSVLKRDLELSAVAVEATLASQMRRRGVERDYTLRDQLRARAVTLPIRKDELIAVTLPLTTLP